MDAPTNDTVTVKGLFLDQPKASNVGANMQIAVLLSKNSKYRGEVLICSTEKAIYGLEDQSMIAVAELIEVKPVSDFRSDDWTACNLAPHRRHNGKFGYFFTNVRRVVEMPARAEKRERICDLQVSETSIIPYPKTLKVDMKGFELAKLTKTDTKTWSAHARHQPHLLQSLKMSALRILGRFRKLFSSA